MASFGGGTLKSLNYTDSWGISPGSGQAVMPGDDFSLTAGDNFSLTFGARTIYGVVKNPIRKMTTEGLGWEVTLVDNREKLSWEALACQFNITDIEEVDPANFGKTRRRRYKHIYPNDWHAQIVTYTRNPLTAAAILTALFGATTLVYGWSYASHASLSKPVYNLDFDTGSELGAIIQHLADRLALVVRLSGEYEISFAVKGTGSLPSMSGVNIKESSLGSALSGNPTRVQIIGDRDIYTDTEVPLIADWKTPWEAFLFEPKWIDAVATAYDLHPLPGGAESTPAERASLAAKARTITVLEWVLKTGDATFADYGRFGDVGRMHLPAWVYITQIVYKAYRIPGTYTLNGIELKNLKIWEGLLSRVTVNATTGEMSYYLDGSGNFELYTDDKAYIVATGQQLDLSDPAKRDVLDPALISSLSALWQPCQRFRIDPRNYAIIFEDAVFQPGEGSAGLFIFVNSGTDLAADHPSKYLAIPNADFTMSVPSIKGAFSFEAERYSRDYGAGLKGAAHYLSGLCLHALMLDNVFNTEIKYDTDPAETVAQKSQKAAESVLAQSELYASGNFTRLGAWGTDLTPTIDRVTYTLGDGIREDIDLTKERVADYFEPERQLDRAKTADELYPNMRANRDEARNLEYQSRVLAGLSVKQTRVYTDLSDVFRLPVGNQHPATTLFYSAETYDAGEVVFSNPAGDADTAGKAFQGVVTSTGVTSGVAIPVATQGVIPVKLTGPCVQGDTVGCDTGSKIARVGGSRPIGTVLQSYPGTGTVWLPVRIGGLGSSSKGTSPYYIKVVSIDLEAPLVTIKVELDSWLVATRTLDDLIPITDLDVEFAMTLEAGRMVWLELDLTGVVAASIKAGVPWDEYPEPIRYDDPLAANRTQTHAFELIGYIEEIPVPNDHANTAMVLRATTEEVPGLQLVQRINTNLRVCQDCHPSGTITTVSPFYLPGPPPPEPP